jgi:hypothetical protein
MMYQLSEHDHDILTADGISFDADSRLLAIHAFVGVEGTRGIVAVICNGNEAHFFRWSSDAD